MTYSEKLKSPQWQIRRLEVMRKDNWTCKLCGDKETFLNVHHTVYRNCDIWDYTDDELFTYCEHCHMIVEYFKSEKYPSKVIEVIKNVSSMNDRYLNIFVLIKGSDCQLIVSLFYLDKKTKTIELLFSLNKEVAETVLGLINKNSVNNE